MSLIQHYQGHWNVNINTPVLVDGIGTLGDTWKVQSDQSEFPNLIVQYNFGSGFVSCTVGEYIVYDGARWLSSVLFSSTSGVTAGTVTSVNTSGLPSLFISSVATPSTTPVISFAAISQPANLFYASCNGVSGFPLWRSLVVNDFNSGTGASASTFWRGDGIWSTTSAITYTSSLPIVITGNSISLQQSAGPGIGYNLLTGIISNTAPGITSGTTTQFTTSGMPGLFTATITNSTTTPNLSFLPILEPQNRFYATPDGIAGVPLWRSLVVKDFNSGTNALTTTFWRGDGTWTTTSGITYTATLPIVVTGNNLSITQANNSQNGYLSSTDWSTFNNKQSAGNYSNRVANTDLLAQTTAITIVTYTIPASVGTYSVGGYINITAISVDVLNYQVQWNDENGIARTQNFFPMGVTSPSLGSLGFTPFTPVYIRVQASSAISIVIILTTGIGSVTYDVGGTIIQIV